MAGTTWAGRRVISPLALRRGLAPGSPQVGGVEAQRLRTVRVLLELLQAAGKRCRSAALRNVRGYFTTCFPPVSCTRNFTVGRVEARR